MEFSIKQSSPEKLRAACLVAGVYEDKTLSAAAKALDKASGKALSAIVARGDLGLRAGATLMLHKLAGVNAERVLLVGLGKSGEQDNSSTVNVMRGVFSALAATTAANATLFLFEGETGKDAAFALRQAVIAAADSAYRGDSQKSKRAKPAALKHVTFATVNKPAAGLKAVMESAAATAHGMDLAKTLGNLPGNVCTPSYLANQAKTLARSHRSIKTTVLEASDMKRLKMGSFLAVAQGSEQPPKLITMEYYGTDRKHKPIVLVGKGITFDSGGISIKPGAEMDEMKYDMCGAASVLGTMQAIAEMGLKLNVVGIVPTCENLPSGRAIKPGDIVTSMSGQTIEILNTDAEGRLILCDALTYAKKFNPDTVIDIATLTGACIIALCNLVSGMFANQDKLAQELVAAANESHDRIWQLPLWDDYQPLLDSNFADMANIGGRAAGTITAACFLARFTKQYRWAHLDIAGTAWKSGKEKGATGRPVPLLTQYLIDRAGK